MPRVDFPLYLVSDRHQTRGRPLVSLIRVAVEAGVRAVQLREKDLDTRALLGLAEEVLRITREHRAVLLVNDRLDLAMAAGGDGVHLRSSSIPVAVTRRILGPDRVIGVSAHTVEEVFHAEANGANFVVLGPVYETASKRGFGEPIGLRPIEEASRRCRIPVFAIGGVTVPRVREVRQSGAFGVAVISAILSAPSVEFVTRQFLDALAAS